ncbi:DUF349 domain-containing protein [Solimicrobium silvestre]|uniref:DUF349 domain-containing protein n=1 Tax=Solimicrobium silvestre TaxID=2099400 RepID=A0A2S9GWF9_9BURK|nr:DUF349 domain-containing protein [Solimicrobium silvestre]PRC92065.1 hypothetical protein S2091_3200 [Solimicrobium silvestre]
MLALIVFNFDAMFDFFFKKRSTAKSSETTQLLTQQQEQADAVAAKFADKQSVKQSELAAAASFAGQESAALAFILQSGYADARYQAAMHLHSAEALMQVSQAMRNTDRRVSKLAQEKLAALQNQQKMTSAVQACLAQGQQLLENTQLMVNQVALWDKERLALGEHGLSLLPIKVTLDERLQAQLELQRQTLQTSSSLRALVETALPLEQLQAQLAECLQQWQAIEVSPLLASLPKNQFNQLNDDVALAQSHVQQLTQLTQLIAARHEALQVWQTAEQLALENVQKEWKKLALTGAALSDEQQEVVHQQEQQLKLIFARIAPTASASVHKTHTKKIAIEAGENQAVPAIDIKSVLVALEQALEEGSLQQALDLDKTLRQEVLPARGELAQRLQVLRAELNRLLDWAKWGGNVSREELIKVADGLVAEDVALTAPEIAKQVGGLRARWKELDRTSGTAAKSVWERFDEACGRAYQIADAHFKQQAQLRLDNLTLAQAQLAAIDVVIADLQNQLPDWKTQLAYIQKVKLEWRKTGSIDRKLKARLESEFEQKIQTLSQPLMVAREAAIGVRQQLIQSVIDIAATDREAADKVQLAQQRWQQEALNLPLERKDEQDLWRQFRAACDAVFAQRKANADEQKQRRNLGVVAKQACCEAVEQSLEASLSSAEIMAVLRKAKQEWRDLSVQHRQAGLDARFETALNALETRHSELLLKDKQAELVHLYAKIKLCQQVEAANNAATKLVEPEITEQSAAWQAEWKLLTTSKAPAELNKLLTQRFNTALAVIKNQQVADAAQVAANLAQFEERLLRVEILRGLPSPAELTQQRLQLQVRDLQSAMKNRDATDAYLSNLYVLCALPVSLKAPHEQRFQLVLTDYSGISR